MTELYDALDVCLQALEQGKDLESVLRDYPEFSRDLRPILETSLKARSLGDITVPADVHRRSRSRLLQRARELRLEQQNPRYRMIPVYSRLAVALGLAAVFFLSSTGLVSASAASLPGDQLYPVKRTWEDVRLFFTFNPQDRDILESEYEQERLDEIDGLLAENKAASVNFSGLVSQQSGDTWLVSGIPVHLTGSTQLTSGSIINGMPVNIIGVTHSNGEVEAQAVQVLAAGVSLPPLEPSDKDRSEGKSNKTLAPTVNPGTVGPHGPMAVQTPEQNSNTGKSPHTFEFHGVVSNIQAGNWTINGQSVYVEGAQINGTILPGSVVTFQGYYNQDGTFVVTRIEEQGNGGSNSSNKDSGNKDSGNNTGSNSGDTSSGGNGSPGNGEPGDH